MKPMSKLDPKLMQLGEDVPSVWGVDGGRGDLTVSKESIKSGSFRKQEGVKSARRPGGPEARRPGGPEARRPGRRGRSLDIGSSPRRPGPRSRCRSACSPPRQLLRK